MERNITEFARERYDRLRSELEILEYSGNGEHIWIPKALIAIGTAMGELKIHLREHPFESKAEEIHFFKQDKPAFQRWHIYCVERMSIAAGKPQRKRKLLKYYEDLMGYYDQYLGLQAFSYHYFKRGGSELDTRYFIRGNVAEPTLLPEMPEEDPEFSTAGSYLFAKFMAVEQLHDYLVTSANALRNKNSASKNGQKPPITWTASKAQFIELAYALQSTGVFNNGNVDVKQVFEYLTDCFNITVTNYYSYFQSMRIRKKDRTPFLKMLMDYTIRRMDDSDEFPRYG